MFINNKQQSIITIDKNNGLLSENVIFRIKKNSLFRLLREDFLPHVDTFYLN
jgi:hypothetical protein